MKAIASILLERVGARDMGPPDLLRLLRLPAACFAARRQVLAAAVRFAGRWARRLWNPCPADTTPAWTWAWEWTWVSGGPSAGPSAGAGCGTRLSNGCAGLPGRPPGGDAWFNSGGPRSRVVNSPLAAAALSEGSEVLGTADCGQFHLRPEPGWRGSLRSLAAAALEALGFRSPEQAWEALRNQLPDRPALVLTEHAPCPGEPQQPAEVLRHALVLGRCCGSLFCPTRPLIWTERRLARAVRLATCDPATFTAADDE